jgi:hypothetical protein
VTLNRIFNLLALMLASALFSNAQLVERPLITGRRALITSLEPLASMAGPGEYVKTIGGCSRRCFLQGGKNWRWCRVSRDWGSSMRDARGAPLVEAEEESAI